MSNSSVETNPKDPLELDGNGAFWIRLTERVLLIGTAAVVAAQVIFHVATLMPTKETDPACTNKKRHIGNDYVTIVYNDSGDEYALNTIRGQFNHACVVVEPLDHATHRVILKCRDDLHDLMGGPVEPKLVSDRNVALLSRQMAFHANVTLFDCSFFCQLATD